MQHTPEHRQDLRTRAQSWLEDLLSGNPHRQFEMIAVAVASTTMLFALVAPHPWLIGMNLLCASVALCLLLIQHLRPHWRVRLTWALWTMIQITAVNGVIWQGGVWSLAMGYFFASSVGMLMMINVRAVIISIIITICVIAVLAWVEAMGGIQPSVVAPNNLIWPMTLFLSLLFGFISLPLVAHHTQRRLAQQLKADNQALFDTHEELRNQHRMQEQFVASVSHELRTPMNAIMGFLQTIDRHDHLSADEQEMLDLMEYSAQQLLQRINELLDFSQLQAGKLRIRSQAMDLRHEIDQLAQAFVTDLKGKPVRLNVLVSPSVPAWLMGDPERVRQIVSNLLSNAVKFTAEGDIRVEVTTAAQRIVLAISDTGPGIAEAELERIFNRLSNITSRTRRELGGTGLGLSIAKALTELMGGQMHVQSRVGKGSTFSIELPLAVAAAPAHASQQQEKNTKATEVQGNVLIVDDSPVNRLVAQNLLRAELPKVNILEADSGAAALTLMESQPIDVVLMDIIMPGMNGIETTTRLQARWGDRSPTVMGLTADASEEVKTQCRAAGMATVIYKPFDRSSLSQPVLRALQRQRLSEL